MTKNAMYVLGAVLVLVGLLGFFNNPVLGIFGVDLLHNLVHLASGAVALITAGMGELQAKMGAKILGVVYALVAVLGFVWPSDMVLGLIKIDNADDFLHLALAVVFLGLGFMGMQAAMPKPGMKQ